jgi:iron-sulfur cluster repair protein YtfE (RIC family)
MNWLNHDHKSFESAVYKCRSACDDANWSFVQQVFAELVENYKLHVRIEEEVLFPAYEQHPGVTAEPTDFLRADHKQIFSLMEHISSQLNQKAYDTVAEDLSFLYRTMIGHHDKEEQIFLPMASEALYSDKNTILEELKSQIDNMEPTPA